MHLATKHSKQYCQALETGLCDFKDTLINTILKVRFRYYSKVPGRPQKEGRNLPFNYLLKNLHVELKFAY